MTALLALLRVAWPYLAAAGLAFGAGWTLQGWRTSDTLADLRVDLAKKDTELAKRDTAGAITRADQAEASLNRERQQAAENERIRNEYDSKVAVAESRARDLSGRLFAALQARSAAALGGGSEATVAAAVASRTAELELAVTRYDTACQADAAQLSALIGQVRPQL